MNVKTAEQYLARYVRRGETRAAKTSGGDRLQGMRNRCWPQDDHAFRSKPNHGARAVALPLKPLGPPRRPVQKDHPRTEPLAIADRIGNYARQTGRPHLTARQSRRVGQKRWATS